MKIYIDVSFTETLMRANHLLAVLAVGSLKRSEISSSLNVIRQTVKRPFLSKTYQSIYDLHPGFYHTGVINATHHSCEGTV